MKLDVLVVGEALVDFVPLHRGSLRSTTGFELHSGGAPANVAIGCARLGAHTAFVGVVGDDEFGYYIRYKLEGEGVGCEHLRHTSEQQTGLCFITLDEDGDRSFMHRGGDAAALLAPEDIPIEVAAQAKVVQFSGPALRSAGGAEAIARLAQAAGGLVCCDPGFVPAHWADPAVFGPRLVTALGYCDVIKCSAEEVEPVIGLLAPAEAARQLVAKGAKLAIVTDGARGAYWARVGEEGHVPSPQVTVVDTTGAGDAFQAALITRLAKDDQHPKDMPRARLISHLTFACAVGAAAVTRRGAIAGLPTV